MKAKKPAGKTSENVSRTGTYVPECCTVEVFFEKGKTFQRCPKCERLTDWQLLVLPERRAA